LLAQDRPEQSRQGVEITACLQAKAPALFDQRRQGIQMRLSRVEIGP
jgi:hypothetical protein